MSRVSQSLLTYLYSIFQYSQGLLSEIETGSLTCTGYELGHIIKHPEHPETYM